MSSPVSTAFKVGVTSIVALLFLFGGILWVKEYDPTARHLRFTVVFVDGKGIAAGDPVQVAGIKIGEISDVYLTEDSMAALDVHITKDVRLTPDSSFLISDVGLMGDKAMVVELGISDEPFDESAVYTGESTKGMSDLMVDAGEVLEHLRSISARFDRDLDIARLTGTFEDTFVKMQETLDIYRTIATDNRKAITRTFERLESTADATESFLESTDNRLDVAVTSFHGTTEKLSRTLDSLEGVGAIVDTLSTRLDSREGTFARLITSDELYDELRRTNASIDSFITDFRRSPGKYTKDMKFKVRLF